MPGRRHKRSRWAASGSDSDAVRRQVSALFERRFEFEPPVDGWRLPEKAEQPPEDWEIPELQAMKRELNAIKSRLSDKDIISWHQHTCATSRAGLVVSSVKRLIRPEMGTQAWCKFYELLSLWAVLPDVCGDGGTQLRSLHLCEAPGAFVTALNHYCVLNRVPEWEWRASTLNPYYEGNPLSRMISDDRFILHTLERWEFGADNTGDILAPENAEKLLSPQVNLVTADGSVDCQGQPAEQESIVSELHLCEVLCALRALQPGGTLVIKMFTFYEASSVCLLYVLNCCFEQVSVVKPSCSKAGNSEVYVVCRRRVAGQPSAALLTGWWRRYGTQETHLRPLLGRQNVPDSFVHQLIRCAGLFKSLQESEIGRNLRLFSGAAASDPAVWEEIDAVRQAAVTEFLRRCRLTPIDKHLRLTHPLNTRLYTSFQMENKSGSGTYEQRTVPRSARERLRAVAEELAALSPPPSPGPGSLPEELPWRPAVSSMDPCRTEGRPPSRLLASKFCCLHQLRFHRRAVEAVSELEPGLLAVSVGPEVSRTDSGILVTLPWRAEPQLCDVAAVTALREAAALLRPTETLRVTGLYLLHRLNISVLQLMVLRAGVAAGAVLLPPGARDSPPQPCVELRAVAEPAAMVAVLDSVLLLLADGRCVSLLPLTELCQRPGAEQLVGYNGRMLQTVTEYLVRSVGTGQEPEAPAQTEIHA